MNKPQTNSPNLNSKNRVGNVSRSVKEIYAELGRVTWPTREETFRLSVIVIAISMVAGLFLGAVDLVFSRIISFFINN